MSLIFNCVVNLLVTLFLHEIQVFCSFISAWMISFSISWRAHLLLRNTLRSLAYLRMPKISLYFLKGNFAGYRILSCQGFFLFCFVFTFSSFNSHPIAFWPLGFLRRNQLLVLLGLPCSHSWRVTSPLLF